MVVLPRVEDASGDVVAGVQKEYRGAEGVIVFEGVRVLEVGTWIMVPADLRPAPEFGQQTEEVLLELGRSSEDIARLKESGAVP